MTDKKDIRRQLWDSLDMISVKLWFFTGIVLALFVALLPILKPIAGQQWLILILMESLYVSPFFIFCLLRTCQIFQKAESYCFCKAKLSQPIAGRIRNTVRFTVVIEDAEGNRFAVNTHSVFSVRGSFLPSLEDYINKTVTIAYNPETEMVVVIG